MDHPKISADGSGTLRLGFGEYGKGFEVAAVSGDGGRALVVREVGTARIYDVETGSLLATFEPTSPLTDSNAGPTSSPFRVFIESADLNPDGTVAALGLNDGSCHLYNVESGSLIARLKEPIGLLPHKEMKRRMAEEPADRWELIRCLAISPDGNLLALGHFEATVSVWQLATQEVIAYLRPSEKHATTGSSMPRSGFVTSIGFSKDSRHLFSGTSDGLAYIWDIASGELAFSATRHTARTLAISIVEDQLSWIQSNGEIRRSTKDGHSEVIADLEADWYSAQFSRDGKTAMTWGRNGDIQRIDNSRKKAETLVNLSGRWSDRLVPFALGTNDKESFYLSSEATLTQLGTNRVIGLQSKFGQFVHSPDRTMFAVKTWGSIVAVHRSSDGELMGAFDSGTTPGSVAISTDNKRILIGELGNGGGLYDRHAFLYDIESGMLLQKFVADQFQILGVGFGTDSNRFVTKSKSISVWEYSGEKVKLINRHQIENHSNKFHVFGDGRMIVFQNREATLLDELGQVISKFDFSIGFDETIVFDEARDRMVCARSYQRLEVWDFVAGKKLWELESDFPTPDRIPSQKLRKHYRFVTGASIWKSEFGNFLHQGDGPRGWVTPLKTSDCGDFVVIPTENRGLIVQVSTDRVIGECPFRGRLRAARCSDSFAIMINSEGELFKAKLL